ncbi:MAG: DUF2156 domain-containing protein [Kofleriaceae bacterium]
MSVALVAPGSRARAKGLIQKYGRDTVAFQTLESGFRYWFADEDAVVAYVDTGGAWVAGGSPVAEPSRITDVAHAFTEAARAHGKRASFFAAEARLTLPHVMIGEQPVWRTDAWPELLTGSLRYQLNRARNKGVSVRRVEPGDLATLEPELARLANEWQASKRMAPMGFLVQLEPYVFADDRMLFVAEHEARIVGLASTVPVPAAGRVFVEDLVRSPAAPNGTPELLVDAAMRAARTPEVTLGLAPLAGDVPRWLKMARWLGSPLYDFAGLRRFKAKLKPHAWEPVYLCTEGNRMIAMRDALRAFACGSLVSFAGKTLFRADRRR